MDPTAILHSKVYCGECVSSVSASSGIATRSSLRSGGEIQPTERGARLVGTMGVHGSVLAFMVIWFGFLGIICLVTLSSVVSGGKFQTALFPFGLLAFGIALVLGSFITEARKALRAIASVVDATRAELR